MTVKSLLKTLLVLCLATCFGVATVLFCTTEKKNSPQTTTPSENEQFFNLQQKYEQNLERTIIDLLEPLVGRGKVRVAIKLELNLKNNQIKHRTETQNLNSEQTDTQTSLWADITEKQVQNLVQRQHIGIVIDGTTSNDSKHIYQPRSQTEMEKYLKLVESAIGYDPARGDSLEIQNMPFAFYKSTRHGEKKSALTLAVILASLAFLLLLICVIGCEKQNAFTADKSTPFSAEKFNQILQFPERAVNVFKNWIYLPPSPKNSDWTPLQKTSIVLLTTDEDFVRQILIALDDDEVRKISKTMATLGVIPPKESARILNELYDAMFMGSTVIGNSARAQQIMMNNKKTPAYTQQNWQDSHQALWQELENISAQNLALKLDAISPELIAYILYQLSAQKAAEIIPYFATSKANQILIHLSHIGQIRAETSQKLSDEALAYARHILDTINTPSGTEKATEILTQLHNTTVGQSIIDKFSQQEPSLAKKLSAQLIRFEDLPKWSSSAIRTLLRNTPRTTVLYALIGAPQEILKQIQGNVPPAIWLDLEKEIKEKEKQVSSDLTTQARQKIIDIARKLLQQEKIDI